jgi:hypothetical protein
MSYKIGRARMVGSDGVHLDLSGNINRWLLEQHIYVCVTQDGYLVAYACSLCFTQCRRHSKKELTEMCWWGLKIVRATPLLKIDIRVHPRTFEGSSKN